MPKKWIFSSKYFPLGIPTLRYMFCLKSTFCNIDALIWIFFIFYFFWQIYWCYIVCQTVFFYSIFDFDYSIKEFVHTLLFANNFLHIKVLTKLNRVTSGFPTKCADKKNFLFISLFIYNEIYVCLFLLWCDWKKKRSICYTTMNMLFDIEIHLYIAFHWLITLLFIKKTSAQKRRQFVFA